MVLLSFCLVTYTIRKKYGNGKNFLKNFRMLASLKLVSEERNNSLKYETIIKIALQYCKRFKNTI